MKKILKYSTIIGTAVLLSSSATSIANADTGGYVRIKNMDSHLHAIGFRTCNDKDVAGGGSYGGKCKFASGHKDLGDATTRWAENKLRWASDDGEGIVVGADFGFFRLELEGQYIDGAAKQWREYAATGGTVHQARLFGNIVAEPFDLLELLGEFGGIEPLVKYNPAHYGISPYAMYGIGVMGGLLQGLDYNRMCNTTGGSGTTKTQACAEEGAFGGGATAAVNAGAGVNIGLDKLARGFSDLSGATLPEYFKLPIEFSVGYHWQVGLDENLWNNPGEDLGIDDGGVTYSVGLKW